MLKISRNDPCLCGSGKKYKKCCLLDLEKDCEVKRALNSSDSLDEAKIKYNEPIKKYTVKIQLVQHGLYDDLIDEISRTIEVSGKESLYGIHMKIQYAFEWDNDHMFSFYLSNQLYDSETEYSGSPYEEHDISRFGKPTKSASDFEVRDLKLEKGREFLYLFDYGDSLIHQVTIIDIVDHTSSNKIPFKIIEQVGENLEQYGSYDDGESEI